jgi:hypothetical protein
MLVRAAEPRTCACVAVLPRLNARCNARPLGPAESQSDAFPDAPAASPTQAPLLSARPEHGVIRAMQTTDTPSHRQRQNRLHAQSIGAKGVQLSAGISSKLCAHCVRCGAERLPGHASNRRAPPGSVASLAPRCPGTSSPCARSSTAQCMSCWCCCGRGVRSQHAHNADGDSNAHTQHTARRRADAATCCERCQVQRMQAAREQRPCVDPYGARLHVCEHTGAQVAAPRGAAHMVCGHQEVPGDEGCVCAWAHNPTRRIADSSSHHTPHNASSTRHSRGSTGGDHRQGAWLCCSTRMCPGSKHRRHANAIHTRHPTASDQVEQLETCCPSPLPAPSNRCASPRSDQPCWSV